MDNPVAKALHDGLDRMRTVGWTKYELCDPATLRVCARGALLGSQPGDWYNGSGFLTSVQRSAQRLLESVAAEQFPERDVWADHDLGGFNNHPDTTQEDVERIFEKAIVKAYETL